MEKATEEHRWLRQLVGEWTCEMEMRMGPDKPPEVVRGRDRVRAIGDFWIVSEGEHDVPGGEGSGNGNETQMLMTLGYDPKHGGFCGTFVHAMSSYLWHYKGKLDSERNALVLESEGPSMQGDEGLLRYRDTMTIISEQERTFSSQWQGTDGNWNHFMLMRFRRA